MQATARAQAQREEGGLFGFVRISVSLVVMVLLVLIGVGAALYRYIYGIGAISNLSDGYGWGLWISFDLLIGVATAAGGFVMAAVVYVLRKEYYRPLVRPAILTAMLGYTLVIVALMVDLGHPERIWYMIRYQNFHSVMFEVGLCVMLYWTTLILEFSPNLLERLKLNFLLKIIHAVTPVLVVFGIVLSTLHQSSLGSLFLIVPGKLYPLWYSPLLPLFFFMTAVAIGPSMVIIESTLSSLFLKRGFETKMLGSLSKVIPYILGSYLVVRAGELIYSGDISLIFVPRTETALFWAEIIVGSVIPIVLFSMPSIRRSQAKLFCSASLVIIGAILMRFNVSWLALSHQAGYSYVPNILEVAVTVGIVTAGVLVFWVVANTLPLFADSHHADSHS